MVTLYREHIHGYLEEVLSGGFGIPSVLLNLVVDYERYVIVTDAAVCCIINRRTRLQWPACFRLNMLILNIYVDHSMACPLVAGLRMQCNAWWWFRVVT